MSRYIDAEYIEYEPMLSPRGNGMYDEREVAYKDEIDDIPTADVRENVRGEWIPHDLENGEKSIDEDCCSVCGERFREIAMTGCEWNFCPNCGSDMRGEA